MTREKIVQQLVKVLLNKNYHALIVLGKEGIGKTTIIENVLEDKEYVRISGYSTPMSFHEQLYENRDKDIIWLDDVEGLFTNKVAKASLKSLLDPNKKRVDYRSNSFMLEAPESFSVDARIIVTGNSFPSDKEFKAVKDRCLFYEYNLSTDEIKNIVVMIIQEKEDITPEKKQALCDYVRESVDSSTEGLSLRLADKLIGLSKSFPVTWVELANELIKADPVKRVFLEVEAMEDLKVRQRQNIFASRTGRSRRTYFNMKREMVQK